MDKKRKELLIRAMTAIEEMTLSMSQACNEITNESRLISEGKEGRYT